MSLRILVAHNFYGDRAVGGEATVFAQEVDVLRLNGCETRVFERSNAEILSWPFWKKATLPLRFGHSEEIYREVTTAIKEFRPDVLHAHNYKYVLTPSIFKAAKDCGVKTVLTLHNYRLICPGGQLRRGDKLCEECLKRGRPTRVLWRSGCASKFSTRILQALFYFETKKSILENVDAFISLTEFSKRKFIEGGLPQDRLWVKPNFIFDPLIDKRNEEGLAEEKRGESNACFGEDAGLGQDGKDSENKGKGETAGNGENDGNAQNKKGAIFVGRLSSEKGIRFLLKAWRGLKTPLTVVGGGPEAETARRDAPANVFFVGEKNREETMRLMQLAEFQVFPSICYEGFPMSILEAAALGVPTIASNLGGRGEMIVDGETGLLYESGNIEDFRNSVLRLSNDREFCRKLGRGARRRYEALYSPRKNFELLMEIYRAVLN